MYTRRVQLANYGPIEKLDIKLPFEGDTPKPVVLVGENGSGKSILLSHIVNGLLEAKSVAYPNTPEVELGTVYKLRSSFYIKPGSEYYFGRVDFEDGLFVTEMQSRRLKREYETVPIGLSEPDIQGAWDKMEPEGNDYFDSSFSPNNKDKINGIFAKRCILYFPPNRFEEPAWLNEENLKAQAQYMDLKYMKGQTNRKVINYSPLHENQNWLFDVIYDIAAFETKTAQVPITVIGSRPPISVPVQLQPSGNATRFHQIALLIIQAIMKNNQKVRFGVGPRLNRVVSLEADPLTIVPNVFQLSSGETSLLNLFLSILRDFDLSGAAFSSTEDILGVVVVDEIDLHLHAVHQHEVLPSLMRMFPKVQFIVTTHSPLFVLGMDNVFGEDGFALYRLPQGQQISPEEFSEFGNAYQAFIETSKFSNDMNGN